MKTKKILFAAGVTITAILIIQMIKSKKTKKRLTVVAEEGYETAEDILFPKKKFLRLGWFAHSAQIVTVSLILKYLSYYRFQSYLFLFK